MAAKTISGRKSQLELWLKGVIKATQSSCLNKFLKLKKNCDLLELSPDEALVISFIDSISEDSQKKKAFLDNFDKNFFVRRRFINGNLTQDLLKILISLCADAKFWGKPFDIISKLTHRDFYKYYENVQKIFVALPMIELKKMQLNEYLKKKISGDCQLKAYELLRLVQSSYFEDLEVIKKVVIVKLVE